MSDAVVANRRLKTLPVQSIHHLLGMLPTWFLVLEFPSGNSDAANAGAKDSKPSNSRRVKTRYYSYEVYWPAQLSAEEPRTKGAPENSNEPTPEKANWIVRQSGR